MAQAQLEAERSDSPRAKLAARRAAARHAELRQATSAGLWRVHLLAGAATAEDAARVARLLRASADLARPALRAAARPPHRRRSPDRAQPRAPARRPLPGRPRRWQWAVAAERSAPPAISRHTGRAPPAPADRAVLAEAR